MKRLNCPGYSTGLAAKKFREMDRLNVLSASLGQDIIVIEALIPV